MQGFALLNMLKPHCSCWWHPAAKAGGRDGGLCQTSPHCPADWHTELFWGRCWHTPFTNVPSKWGQQIYKKKENIQDSYDHFVPGQQAQNPSHKRRRKWGKRGKVELKLAQKDAALARSLQLSGPQKWQFKEKLFSKHLPQSLCTKRSHSTHGQLSLLS